MLLLAPEERWTRGFCALAKAEQKILGEARGQRRGGGRLSRTETLTIRLDPKLNYLCELAARAQRRTKSSFVESALADRIDTQPLYPRESRGATIGEMAQQLWHVREHERLISLAEHAPHLMSFGEQQIWALIAEHSMFWFGRWRSLNNGTEQFEWEADAGRVRHDQVASQWETLVKIADGRLPSSALPSSADRRQKSEPEPPSFDSDDEIPF